MAYKKHYSVLNKEVVDILMEDSEQLQNIKFADMTFGAGGHTFALAESAKNVSVYSVDQDPDALKNGKENINELGLSERVFLHDMNFEQFPEFIRSSDSEMKFNGIVADLGVSSHHFDEGDRGFSFRFDAPLDMRMDVDNDELETAADIVNNYSKEDLEKIFFTYGEEKFTHRIVKSILEHRESAPIETTKQLEKIIIDCYPKKLQFGKINPATKCFQALRIKVNKELDVLENVIPGLLELLEINGRLAIITFHSLEDRIVKNLFKDAVQSDVPYELYNKKPILPSHGELEENPRSRSAKLRVITKINEKKSKNKYAQFSKIGENR
ncbi:putative S-adenosyl-methyltransferase [Halobacteriovorax marinus SJ]|uniref:Ribosomal RNA small subunit methyltransferase H n=1 Tax=Halobacteriovorax marinus (strain ATCC BAA-682 / DSM 15412 / SJ) TaxID=862908 RepID=E1X242_HALMS|nr:16S rRNA (cytosine(1402)-N(4))-methyltransferase RsmH [Halobacteriovorax marinus]CBW24998.1 putative S-adenosyl-methyltransferase [Halobacteriovorax marinus SJ]